MSSFTIQECKFIVITPNGFKFYGPSEEIEALREDQKYGLGFIRASNGMLTVTTRDRDG